MFKNNLAGNFNEHFQSNFWLYIVSLLFIFTGMVLGIYSVKYIGNVYKNDLLSYINNFIDYLSNKDINYREVFFHTIKNNIPFIIIIWFLGMTMIGMPIILLIDLIKGYTLGFTISFMIGNVGIKGLFIALLGVMPQNIIYVPCILLSSVLAMNFSLSFIKEKMQKKFISGVWTRLLYYSLPFIFIGALMFMGFIIEAYATPNILKILV